MPRSLIAATVALAACHHAPKPAPIANTARPPAPTPPAPVAPPPAGLAVVGLDHLAWGMTLDDARAAYPPLVGSRDNANLLEGELTIAGHACHADLFFDEVSAGLREVRCALGTFGQGQQTQAEMDALRASFDGVFGAAAQDGGWAKDGVTAAIECMSGSGPYAFCALRLSPPPAPPTST